MNAKVSISFVNTSTDAALVTASGRILTMMTGNASYPTPLPALATLTTLRNSYVAAVNVADRGHASVVLRKQQRVALSQALRDLALYVQQTCQGDLVALLSSGFSAHKAKQPIGVLTPPQDLRMSRTKISGQILLRCRAMRTARSYQWQYATTAVPTVWTQSDATTAARFLLTDLTFGVQYIAQARVLGAKGASDWTESATLVAV